ncbi:MAG: hypothetical protein Phog2KO_41370 [Phototrophicaceae bacterium]
MLKKLWLGFRLKCPNCEEGSMTEGLIGLKQECDVCHVKFERKPGESAGASILWVSILPLIAMFIFFAIELTNPGTSLWISAGIPLGFVVIAGVLGYRNARGLWIAISYLTGGVYADEANQ